MNKGRASALPTKKTNQNKLKQIEVMSKTIDEIREYCIQLDLENVKSGDKSIGTYRKGTESIIFENEKEVRLFYWDISTLKLLTIYSEYNGLECYKYDEPIDYANTYSIDILEIIEALKA
jgi:hypothetical protein